MAQIIIGTRIEGIIIAILLVFERLDVVGASTRCPAVGMETEKRKYYHMVK